MLVLNKTTGLQNNSRPESRQGVFVFFFPSCLLTTISSTPQTINAKFEKLLFRIVSPINEWNFSGSWQRVRSIRGHPFPLGRKICISAQICVPRNNLSQKIRISGLPKLTENTLCLTRNNFFAYGAEHVCSTHKLGTYISFLLKYWMSQNFEICCATLHPF